MSYQIIYNKQFIKVNDHQVLPLLCQGSNNCYDYTNRKRTRDWGNTFAHNPTGLIANKCDIIESLRTMQHNFKENYPDYKDVHFGYFEGVALYGHHTSKTTFNMYFNVYKSGMKNAKTIEELRNQNVTVTMFVSNYSKETILKANKAVLPEVTFESTEHMVATINEWVEYYKGVTNIHIKTYGLK
jgi:hypothetical protein